ncbi:MFS transporter [Microbacterium sp. NPDC016588]
MRAQLAGFSLLFAAGMWMSKVAQPLHFAEADAMVAFGVGYAIMAVVGGLSFIWGAIADRVGGLAAVRAGATIYAIGIAGRMFTDIGPSIAFSAIAGAGASLALVGIRPWIRAQATDGEIPKIVAARNLGNQTGVVLGSVGAAAVFALANQTQSGPVLALWLAPVLVLLGVLWLLFSSRSRGSWTPQSDTKASTSGHARISVKLAIVGVLSGFYVSLVVPYIPLVLTQGGLPDYGAAIVVAAMSSTQIAATGILARLGTRARPFALFVVSEAATGVLTIGVALALQMGWALVAVLLLTRAACIAIAVTTEETLQYAVIPAGAAGLVFGISQTAFLVGDAAGGALGGFFWTSTGAEGLMLLAGGATFVNAFLLPALLHREVPESARAG